MRLLRLALRNLARNRRRTLLSLLAIMIGVGAMVTFRGLVNGMRGMMVGGLVHGQSGAVQVHRKGYVENVLGLPLDLDMADSPELRRRLLSVPGVTGLAPRITFGAMISTPDVVVEGREPTAEERGKTTFFLATAIEPEGERRVTPRRFEWVREGRMFASPDAREVVLNADLAQSLGLRPLPDAAARPPETEWPAVLAGDRDGALNGEAVVLSGTQVSAMPGDRKLGLLPLATAQRLLRMEGRVTEYAVGVEHMEDAPRVRDALRAALGPDYEVHTWDELMPFIPEIIDRQDFLLGMVGTIFLVVVLLGIVNAMLMNVLERVREIGTMLAVGMRRRQVVALLMMEGAGMGALGGGLGALLGWAVVGWLHHRGILINAPGAEVDSVVRPFIPLVGLARAAIMATLGATLAALWPAYRASLLRPVEALRAP